MPPDQLSEEQLIKYLLLKKRQHQPNSMRPLVAAIKFFFTHTAPRDWKTLGAIRIPKVRTLPKVLTSEKVWALLAAIKQPYWHAFFLTVYTCGLRLSDALELTPANIDADRQHVHVKKTKNSNERFVPLPIDTLEELRNHWKTHRNGNWLFPSRALPKQMHLASRPSSNRSAQRALQLIVGSLDWNDQGISPHTLRHSYATAMLEAGINIKVLQQYLGHRNLQATEIYLHLTRNSDAAARKLVQEHMNRPKDSASAAAPSGSCS